MATDTKKRKKQHWKKAVFPLLLAAAVGILILRLPKETETAQTFPPVVTLSPEEGGAPAPDDPLMMLVNRDNPLPEDYAPALTDLQNWNYTVATVVYDDLCRMLEDGRAEGLRFQICSAYRTRDTQQRLFDEDVAKLVASGVSESEAVARTAQYTMPPGCSEHETGLALDIVSQDHQLLDEAQENTAETQWLHEHCWEYGFILRYPPEKSSVTGIAYEPWHYRYVGRDAARWLTKNDLTLEEFWTLQESMPVS